MDEYLNENQIANACILHADSKQLHFLNSGRKIQRSRCLGHSRNGCITYSGIDLTTGQLLYITEWTLTHSQLKSKCTMKCLHESDKCDGHSVDEIIKSIEDKVIELSQFQHENLVAYECVSCEQNEEGVLVHLAQEFVHGTSVNDITQMFGRSNVNCSFIANGIIEALIFLHNQDILHANLNDRSVFMEKSSACRVTDFALIPYLRYLNGTASDKQGDLPALGYLIESLMLSSNADVLDFIEQCKTNFTLSAFELLAHEFLSTADHTRSTQGAVLTRTVDNSSSMEGQSRLQLDFDVEQGLGSGCYGDVLKVRNFLDNRQYAIKRIQLKNESCNVSKKITREVELLSRLNHPNVVRYFTSWIENVNKADLKMNDDDEYSDDVSDCNAKIQ